MAHSAYQIVSPAHPGRFDDYYCAHRGFFGKLDGELSLLARMQAYDIHALILYQDSKPAGYLEFLYEPGWEQRSGWVQTSDYFIRIIRAVIATPFQGTGLPYPLFNKIFDVARGQGLNRVWVHNCAPPILHVLDKLNREPRRFAPFKKAAVPPRKELFQTIHHLSMAPHVQANIQSNPLHHSPPKSRWVWRKPWSIPM